jgi:uncharacterized protein involved in exopolysaccharide biosynthesis
MPGSFPWFLALVLFATFSFAPKIHPQENSSTPASSKTAAGSSESAANQQELEAMKADLQRMRSLLSQMQTNLAFVGSTTTPLNHEFELQIEMWRVLITQTERHVQEMERTGGANRPK